MNENQSLPRISRGPLHYRTAEELVAMIRENVPEKICTVSTVATSGQPECAVLGFALLDDGKIVLHTHKYSRKWANLRSNPALAMSISAGIYAPYFQIEGTAELVDREDRHRSLEATYTREHPKALALANNFTTGSVLVTPRWARCFEWPRTSGHCVEWLIVEALASCGASDSLFLRNSYEDERPRISEFLHRQGTRLISTPLELVLIAEENQDLVGVIVLQEVPQLGLAIIGPCVKACINCGEISANLVEYALQVAYSRPCLAFTSIAEQPFFVSNGFQAVPLNEARLASEQLKLGAQTSSDYVVLALNKPSK